MGLKLQLDGFQLEFAIHHYRPSGGNRWTSEWCGCDFHVSWPPVLNYQSNRDAFLSREVEDLTAMLTRLLDGELPAVQKVEFMEPDFVFILVPREDLRKNPRYTHLAPGHEFKELYAHWRIHFWDSGRNAHFMTLQLNKEQVKALRDYLLTVIHSDNSSGQER